MSQLDGRPQNGAGGGGGVGVADTRRRRAASVTLREGADGRGGPSVGDLMDPANKSLADALKIAYRLMQLLIIVMIVVFALSGFQQVGASEVGVRVTLGRIDARNLAPGLRFSWPQPIGDIIKVPTNNQTVELKKEFFPNLSEAEEKLMGEKGEQGLREGGRDALDPDTDGALLTADGYLVHTRWLITYRRTDATPLERIARDSDAADPNMIERQIVTAAARRGVVHAAARMNIDEVLSNQPSPRAGGRTFSDLARLEAQQMLDGMDLGLTIQTFDMKNKMPPRFVMTDFNAVQSAEASAQKVREEARSEALQKLTKAAGEGAMVVLAQIEKYGVQLAKGETAEAEKTLAIIHDLMLRKPVQIDGKDVVANVSGDVSTTLAEAEQYRTGVVQRAQGEAQSFAAKRKAFQANPTVFLTGEWADAYGTFASRPTLQTMLLPEGLERLVVQINKDPSLAKMMEEEISKRETEEADRKRREKRQRELYQQKMQGTTMEGT